MKNKIIKTTVLCIFLTCLAHTCLTAQQPATIVHVGVEEFYPANRPVSIHVVFQAAGTTILPPSLEFECTVGNKPPLVVTYPDTLLPNTTDTFEIYGLVFDKGSNFLEIVMKQDGSTGYHPGGGNGSTWVVVQGLAFPGETLVEDFEVANYWYADPGTVWEHGTPLGTQITAAHSGTQAWTTVATGTYPPSVTDYLYSPLFPYDSIGFTDTAMFSFYHYYALADTNDRAYVEFSTDSGTTWGLLGSAGDPLGINWYGHPVTAGFNAFFNTTQGWEYAAYKLPINILGISGVLQFRFVFRSDSSGTSDGWAIDDVTLKPYKPPYDAGAVDMGLPPWEKPQAPYYAVCYWVPNTTHFKYTVTVKIKNYGTDTLTSIPVYLMSNVINPINEVWTGILPPGEAAWHQFATGLMPIPGRNHYTFATNLAGDLNTQNNGFQLPITGVACSTPPPDVSVEDTPANNQKTSLLVYPNPATSMVYLSIGESSEKIYAIELINIHGQQVAINHPHNLIATLDISHLVNGIYIARVSTNKNVLTRYIVKSY